MVNRFESDLDGVVGSVNIDIPPKLAEQRLERMLQREAYQRFQEGMDEKSTEAYVEKRKPEIAKTVEDQIRSDFVVDAIAKKERIFVTEEDVERQITSMAMQRGMQPQELAEELMKGGVLPMLRWDLKVAKVKTLLRQKAEILEVGAGESTEAKAEEKPEAEPEADTGTNEEE